MTTEANVANDVAKAMPAARDFTKKAIQNIFQMSAGSVVLTLVPKDEDICSRSLRLKCFVIPCFGRKNAACLHTELLEGDGIEGVSLGAGLICDIDDFDSRIANFLERYIILYVSQHAPDGAVQGEWSHTHLKKIIDNFNTLLKNKGSELTLYYKNLKYMTFSVHNNMIKILSNSALFVDPDAEVHVPLDFMWENIGKIIKNISFYTFDDGPVI